MNIDHFAIGSIPVYFLLVLTSDYGSFPHSLLGTSKIFEFGHGRSCWRSGAHVVHLFQVHERRALSTYVRRGHVQQLCRCAFGGWASNRDADGSCRLGDKPLLLGDEHPFVSCFDMFWYVLIFTTGYQGLHPVVLYGLVSTSWGYMGFIYIQPEYISHTMINIWNLKATTINLILWLSHPQATCLSNHGGFGVSSRLAN
jgi:hypothetical protein